MMLLKNKGNLVGRIVFLLTPGLLLPGFMMTGLAMSAFVLSTFLLPAFVMPARAQNVDKYWTAPKYADDIKNPLSGDQKAIKEGEKIYKQMCTVCHGKKGKGDGVASVAMRPRPANFLALRIRQESDGAVFWKLTEGKPPMASYKTLLTEDQRWAVVSYIRELESAK